MLPLALTEEADTAITELVVRDGWHPALSHRRTDLLARIQVTR